MIGIGDALNTLVDSNGCPWASHWRITLSALGVHLTMLAATMTDHAPRKVISAPSQHASKLAQHGNSLKVYLDSPERWFFPLVPGQDGRSETRHILHVLNAPRWLTRCVASRAPVCTSNNHLVLQTRQWHDQPKCLWRNLNIVRFQGAPRVPGYLCLE